jgi:hypothetical protein
LSTFARYSHRRLEQRQPLLIVGAQHARAQFGQLLVQRGVLLGNVSHGDVAVVRGLGDQRLPQLPPMVM